MNSCYIHPRCPRKQNWCCILSDDCTVALDVVDYHLTLLWSLYETHEEMQDSFFCYLSICRVGICCTFLSCSGSVLSLFLSYF
jgi:hypothetical protein